MKTINLSASDLVKKSASQILFFIKNPHKRPEKPSTGQLKGNDYARSVINKSKKSFEEMGGFLDICEGVKVWFSIDLITRDDKLVEIKMVGSEYPQWFLEQSILQSCFLSDLAIRVKNLRTARFIFNKTGIEYRKSVDSNFDFELWFGDIRYKIPSNKGVFNFYRSKAEAIRSDLEKNSFENVKKFDEKYKRKEFEILSPSFKKIK